MLLTCTRASGKKTFLNAQCQLATEGANHRSILLINLEALLTSLPRSQGRAKLRTHSISGSLMWCKMSRKHAVRIRRIAQDLQPLPHRIS